MKTVLEVIQSTTDYFRKHEVESPRLNIEHLLAHVLGKRRMDLYLEFDRPLTELELEPLRSLVKRRVTGEPLQHLLGTVEFLGHTLRCDSRALVPRPETEQLCEQLLGLPAPQRVVDVGTGSGVIALSLALGWPPANVDGVDISEDALALARENAATLGVGDRVKFYRSDLLSGVEGTVDLLVANLPYIATAEIADLSAEVKRDPHLALDGGPDGLRLVERLADEAPRVLRGRLALEIGHGQGDAIGELLRMRNFQDIKVTTDYQGRERFVFAIYG
ncbi:MAG TPA: peptide chain release factor N(5)-glutamine methyltransferase [Chthoniobacteraceae bacterium]|nr:peptide chain release factor N(5)-glutamine methyltransferase [Chthoniobacteraceae bacterium]